MKMREEGEDDETLEHDIKNTDFRANLFLTIFPRGEIVEFFKKFKIARSVERPWFQLILLVTQRVVLAGDFTSSENTLEIPADKHARSKRCHIGDEAIPHTAYCLKLRVKISLLFEKQIVLRVTCPTTFS